MVTYKALRKAVKAVEKEDAALPAVKGSRKMGVERKDKGASTTAFKKFPEKIFINNIELLGWENAVERWRVDTKQKLQKLYEIVKNRDRWDKELSVKTNYGLLQSRFETIEEILKDFLESLK